MELLPSLPLPVAKAALSSAEFLFAENAAKSLEFDGNGVVGMAEKIGLNDEQFRAKLTFEGVMYYAIFDPRFGWNGGVQ